MANSDASSSTTCTAKILVLFYLAATNDGSSARITPIHNEKFNLPLRGDKQKAKAEIAKSKGLAGEKREVRITRAQKAGSGVETFSLRTQDA